MKRTITTISLLCGGLLFINPITNTIFAQSTNNKLTTELVESMDTSKETIIKNEENIIKPEVNSEIEKNESIQTTENNKPEIIEKEQVQSINTVEVIEVLNQEQAKELLEMYNKGVNYTFQGDENAFEVLNQRGLSGYVFLPDYDTDLGFFVDKNSASIYYFHPSGYLELAM